MKTRLAVGITIVLIAVLVWRLWPISAVPPTEQTTGITAPKIENTKPANESVAKSSAPTIPVADTAAQVDQVMENANRPIDFFGKVVDQDGNPIPGVRVTMQIRHTKKLSPGNIADTFEDHVLETRDSGLFELTGERGALLSIKGLEKEGYEPSVKALRSSYWYWREPKDAFHPDAKQPEVFRMWRKSGAEPLVVREKMTRIPYDGTPVNFDLVSGEKVEAGGDIKVSLERNPRSIEVGQRNFDWTLVVEGIGGGVLESDDEQMYRAPVDGYKQQLVVRMRSDDKKWTDTKSVAFYVKSREGKNFGRVILEVSAGSDKPTTGLIIRSFVNPSASRNLEYDPNKRIM